MSLKNSSSKKITEITKKLNSEVFIKLSDSSFNILNESISMAERFNEELGKAQRAAQNNIIVAIEGAGKKAEDFINVKLDRENKQIILIRK